jgi:hypothetical protein
MAQGKPYTEEQREMILESLKDYLELGFSRSRACKMVGFDETTLSKWLSSDEALSMKVQGWENAMNKLALANLRDALLKEAESDDSKKETSKWWSERKMKEDFSTKSETDITSQGQQLGVVILPPKNVDSMETTTETSDSIS